MSDRAYNPLEVNELGRNAARKLMEYPAIALPPDEQFTGGGVYTIYYRGGFETYEGMAPDDPIYVGKADLPGKRQGRAAPKRADQALYRRLAEHAGSVRYAKNLDLADFRCQWLVLDPIWIGLTEQVLISEHRPIWNVVVDGFGQHNQGRTRRNQRRSRWDPLHPGRPWANLCQDGADSTADIPVDVIRHRKEPDQEES